MPTKPRKRLELLWRGSTKASRGPKPKLSLEQIVSTAIGIADREGIDALSMQRLAAELGYTTMSLYRYVPSKEDLIEVMLDQVPERPPAADDSQDWRTEMETWVSALWEVYRRHPWVMRVQITAPPMGPGQLAWFDAGLRPLRKAGLGGSDQVSVLLFLLGAVRQLALISIDVEHGREEAGLTVDEADTDYDAALREFVDPERFPALTALVNEGIFTPAGRPDEGVDLDLQFGVRRVLDGIEAYVRSRARETATTSAAERLTG